MNLRILCIGDVVGTAGCGFLRSHLPAFKKLHHVDLVICNGENSADGNGITPKSADHLFTSGVDVITLGNHSFRRKEVYPYLDEQPTIIRPLNYPSPMTPGKGICTVDMGFTQVTVINLMGQEYIDARVDNPFTAMERLLPKLDEGIVMIDFHAEATSEKRAMALWLDGKVSAVFGTHTHVMTADAEVLPGGTGYITDLGMCGVRRGTVLGVEKEAIIKRFTTGVSDRFERAQAGEAVLDCALFEYDAARKICVSATQMTEII